MSSAAYQTSAKPRGRRGSYSEPAEKPARSRASSSASMRLSKTLSRNLDEMTVSRSSRPVSPVVYNPRSRAFDLRSSDPIVNSRGQAQESKSKAKTQSSVLPYENEKASSTSSPTPVLPSKDVAPATPLPAKITDGTDSDIRAPASDSTKSSQGLTRNTRSYKSLAAMQPTVTEEAEEHIEHPPAFPTTQPLRPQVDIAHPESVKAPNVQGNDVPLPSSPVTSSSSPKLPAMNNARASESSLDELLLAAPLPKAPIPFIPQPVSSVTEEGMPVAVSPSPVFGMGPAQQRDQRRTQSRTPLASPPQSPMLQQYVSSPPLQAIPYPHPFVYQPALMSNPTYSPGFYPVPYPHPDLPPLQANVIPRPGSADAEDERTRLLEKVSNVLPDINRLLHSYQETQGLLTEKENLVKQAESHRLEEIEKVRIELMVTKEEFQKIIGEQATENVRLKGELDEQTERVSRLEGGVHFKEELEDLQVKFNDLEAQLGQSKATAEQLVVEKHSLETELEAVRKEAEDEKTRHARELASLKESFEKRLSEKDEEHTRVSGEQRASLSKIQLDLAGMITKHSGQKKELDSMRATLAEQEQTFSLRTRELEDALQLHKREIESKRRSSEEKDLQHKQEVALWSQRMAESIVRREDMVRELRSTMESQLDKEKKSTEARIASLQERFSSEERRLNVAVEAAKSGAEASRKELEEQRTSFKTIEALYLKEKEAHSALGSRQEAASKHHTEMTDAMLSMRNKQAEWNRESEKMDRILRSLGQLGSSKTRGKGDQYFVSAFEQLALLVEETSKHFFHECVGATPVARRGFQLSGLPDISGETEAARGLRCLAIQNNIFELLHRRVFEPFLFITAYDGDNTYGLEYSLSMIAGLIRSKSVSREGIWRSITLRAIYGSTYGRKAAAAAARAISQEMMERIGPLADPEESSSLLRSVRLIVKAAIQLWRRARLDWDLVYSTMPPRDAWEQGTDMMLWVRPHVVRERINFCNPEEKGNQEGHIYLQGTALRQDSYLVTARRRELLVGEND